MVDISLLECKLNFDIHDVISIEPNNLQHKWGLSKGITLALSSVAAYFLAYQYEVGYFAFFGIPTELITVDTTTLLVIGSTIVGFLTILFQFGDMLIGLTPEGLLNLTGKVRPFVILFLGFLGMWLVFTIFLNFRWRKAIIVPAGATLMFLMQYLSARYCKNRAIPDKVFTLFVIAIVGVGLFRAIGKWSAENQRSFAVLPDQPDVFVIQKRRSKRFKFCPLVSNQLQSRSAILDRYSHPPKTTSNLSFGECIYVFLISGIYGQRRLWDSIPYFDEK